MKIDPISVCRDRVGWDAQAATWGVRHARWAVPEIDRVGGKLANHQNRFNCKFCLCGNFEDFDMEC